jgi:hypothetical protein
MTSFSSLNYIEPLNRDLSLQLAKAVCGVGCEWPNCTCNERKRIINDVALVVAEEISGLKSRVRAALVGEV